MIEIVMKLLFVYKEGGFFKEDVFDYVILYQLCISAVFINHW